MTNDKLAIAGPGSCMELPRRRRRQETEAAHEPTDRTEISQVSPKLEEAIKAAGKLAQQTGSEVTITVDGVTVTIKPQAQEEAQSRPTRRPPGCFPGFAG